MLGSKRVIQDGQRYRVWIRYDFVPGRDGIGQVSQSIPVENWADLVEDLVL